MFKHLITFEQLRTAYTWLPSNFYLISLPRRAIKQTLTLAWQEGNSNATSIETFSLLCKIQLPAEQRFHCAWDNAVSMGEDFVCVCVCGYVWAFLYVLWYQAKLLFAYCECQMIPNAQEDRVAERINTSRDTPKCCKGGERHLNMIPLCHVHVLEGKLSETTENMFNTLEWYRSCRVHQEGCVLFCSMLWRFIVTHKTWHKYLQLHLSIRRAFWVDWMSDRCDISIYGRCGVHDEMNCA